MIRWKNILRKKDVSLPKGLIVPSLHLILNIICHVVVPIKETCRSISMNYCLFPLQQSSLLSLPILILFFFCLVLTKLSRAGSGIYQFIHNYLQQGQSPFLFAVTGLCCQWKHISIGKSDLPYFERNLEESNPAKAHAWAEGDEPTCSHPHWKPIKSNKMMPGLQILRTCWTCIVFRAKKFGK